MTRKCGSTSECPICHKATRFRRSLISSLPKWIEEAKLDDESYTNELITAVIIAWEALINVRKHAKALSREEIIAKEAMRRIEEMGK